MALSFGLPHTVSVVSVQLRLTTFSFPRFAPHLEKCLGMGRNSSRIASRRIQNSTKDNSGHHHSSAAASDDDDDDDWLVDRKRKKRDKNSPRRSKNAKVCAPACLAGLLVLF